MTERTASRGTIKRRSQQDSRVVNFDLAKFIARHSPERVRDVKDLARQLEYPEPDTVQRYAADGKTPLTFYMAAIELFAPEDADYWEPQLTVEDRGIPASIPRRVWVLANTYKGRRTGHEIKMKSGAVYEIAGRRPSDDVPGDEVDDDAPEMRAATGPTIAREPEVEYRPRTAAAPNALGVELPVDTGQGAARSERELLLSFLSQMTFERNQALIENGSLKQTVGRLHAENEILKHRGAQVDAQLVTANELLAQASRGQLMTGPQQVSEATVAGLEQFFRERAPGLLDEFKRYTTTLPRKRRQLAAALSAR